MSEAFDVSVVSPRQLIRIDSTGVAQRSAAAEQSSQRHLPSCTHIPRDAARVYSRIAAARPIRRRRRAVSAAAAAAADRVARSSCKRNKRHTQQQAGGLANRNSVPDHRLNSPVGRAMGGVGRSV